MKKKESFQTDILNKYLDINNTTRSSDKKKNVKKNSNLSKRIYVPEESNLIVEQPKVVYTREPINVPIVSAIAGNSKVIMLSSGEIQCLDQGNFPHPLSCKKFISCARIDSGILLGWEYSCPDRLSFDPVGRICNWDYDFKCYTNQ